MSRAADEESLEIRSAVAEDIPGLTDTSVTSLRDAIAEIRGCTRGRSHMKPSASTDRYSDQLDRNSVAGGAGSGRRFACPCCRFLTLRGGLSLDRARANYAAFAAAG